jgi:L-lactate dehydrogenase complex protein LldG
MAAREEILEALRRNAQPGAPRPVIDGVAAVFPDLAARFAEAVAAVGGTLVRVPDLAAAHAALAALPVHREAKRIASLVPGVGTPTFDPAAVTDPHDLEGTDLAVLPGALAVAENGATWIEGPRLPHHALVVIPEHLAVVVEVAAIVPDLHAAYARLDLAGRPRWGLFLAGPSKTADIEQSLVIGAHGARSLTVLLVGS